MRLPWRCVLVVAVVVGCVLAASCGGGDEEEAAMPTPSPVPSPTVSLTETAGASETASPGTTVTPAAAESPEREVPPSAVLRAGDARQTRGPGTFCWAGFCTDAFAIVVPREPMAVPTGEPLIFELGFDPTEVHVTVWRSSQGEVVWGPSDSVFSWLPARSEEPVLEETPPLGRTIELQPDCRPAHISWTFSPTRWTETHTTASTSRLFPRGVRREVSMAVGAGDCDADGELPAVASVRRWWGGARYPDAEPDALAGADADRYPKP